MSAAGQETASDVLAPSQPLVRVRGVSKTFGPTRALVNASFDLRSGEVHALVGENGSGKSTLVKILSGVHLPETGTIELLGEAVDPPTSPRAAQAHGIATVFQEVLVADALSVLENVWLGADGLIRTIVRASERRVLASDAFAELLERPPDLDIPVERLSLSDRQACCIVRALLRRPRVLVLDEATSSLDIVTRDRLFRIVERLSAGGVGVVFITHRLDELTELGDRTTVMRSGETVATLGRHDWSPRQLVRLMTGSDQLVQRPATPPPARAETVLNVTALQLRPGRRPVDAQIRAGELVGVAGLEGHGQEDFLDALRGASSRGPVVCRGTQDDEVAIESTSAAAANGIFYVPRERSAALFGWMSIRENFGMPTLSRDRRAGWLRPNATGRRFQRYVDELGIVLGRPDDRITTLSGGNQQKVVLARWLAAEPRVLVLNDPTRGVDIRTKQQLYALFVELAARGLAVVMLSTELDEHVELMDRVLVFREHELASQIKRDQLSRTALVSAFFGESSETGDV